MRIGSVGLGVEMLEEVLKIVDSGEKRGSIILGHYGYGDIVVQAVICLLVSQTARRRVLAIE